MTFWRTALGVLPGAHSVWAAPLQRSLCEWGGWGHSDGPDNSEPLPLASHPFLEDVPGDKVNELVKCPGTYRGERAPSWNSDQQMIMS